MTHGDSVNSTLLPGSSGQAAFLRTTTVGALLTIPGTTLGRVPPCMHGAALVLGSRATMGVADRNRLRR
jgi:hypothetical protein